MFDNLPNAEIQIFSDSSSCSTKRHHWSCRCECIGSFFFFVFFVLIFKVNLFNFLSGLSDTSYTNAEGVASFSVRLVNPGGKNLKKKIFLVCSRAFVGVTASISVSREGYILETIERTISNEARQIFQGIFIAPTLNEGELRLVLGWKTTQDLDLHVDQINKYDK